MPLKHKIDPVITQIAGNLAAQGFETYVVGGAVRDLLLGIAPKDYDIATSARPEEVRAVFGRRRARIIGRRFRLVHVYTDTGFCEVSTFRREPTPEERQERTSDDGVVLWRDNQYGNLEQDAKRRDFTVNALYFDPVQGRGIVDLVGGVADLEKGMVRAIGEPRQRLEEDPMRMLRALKLVARYDFRLERELARQLRILAPQITVTSRARGFEELLKILTHTHAYATLAAFQKYGLLEHYWPSLAATWNSPWGALLQGLLRERDRRMRDGEYWPSKALALATVSFPAVAAALGPNESEPLWEYEPGMERECRTAIRDFFAPFPLSRYFTARVREIALLVPRFMQNTRRKRLLGHPEYKYGRELFSLLVTVRDWPVSLLAPWPQPTPEATPRGGNRRRPSRHRRGHGSRKREVR